jgi:hypothetical protein
VEYQVVAYDARGAVIATDDHFLEAILPGEQLGVAGDLLVPPEATVASIDVQLKANETLPFDGNVPEGTRSPLGSTGVTYQDGYVPTVTGMITNALDTDVTEVVVHAVAYDAQGAIIGGGMTYVAFIPAGGKAAAEVYVTTSSRPARVELYPTVTIASDFR